jgi:sialic acid synthase SpsE
VFLSLGGVRPDEVDAELAALGQERSGPDRLTLLIGFQAEPTRVTDTRLARLASWRTRLPHQAFGYMDHTDGAADESGWLAALALPYGIAAIEKHITLDRPLEIEDYVSALAPSDFSAWSRRIRLAEDALGAADLTLVEAEEVYRRKALKVVVAAVDLAAGATLAASDVRLLRTKMPDLGEPALRIDDVVGRRLQTAVAAGAAVMMGDLS